MSQPSRLLGLPAIVLSPLSTRDARTRDQERCSGAHLPLSKVAPLGLLLLLLLLLLALPPGGDLKAGDAKQRAPQHVLAHAQREHSQRARRRRRTLLCHDGTAVSSEQGKP